MEIFTVGEVAKTLGIPRYKITYAVEVGKIREPRRTVMGLHRYYLREDVDEISKVLIGDEREKK